MKEYPSLRAAEISRVPAQVVKELVGRLVEKADPYTVSPGAIAEHTCCEKNVVTAVNRSKVFP